MEHITENGFVVKMAVWFNPPLIQSSIGMVIAESVTTRKLHGFIGIVHGGDETEDAIRIIQEGASILPEAIFIAMGRTMPLDGECKTLRTGLPVLPAPVIPLFAGKAK